MYQKFVERVQPHLDNTLDDSLSSRRILSGIFGDRPSLYAKSPILWNAAFQGLGLDAAFLPFDVTDENLPALVQALREDPSFVGGSVTVPHKSRIMDLLDDLDTRASLIGAVNTVARTADGRLIGYNTDAQGALDSLTKALPGQSRPFLNDLTGLKVLLIGSGGAARAVAFATAEAIGPSGHLTIANRTRSKAAELASSVHRAYGNADDISEDDIGSLLGETDLVINASLRGQSGMRRTAEGMVTCLEPYSSLVPANPASLEEANYSNATELYHAWYSASLHDIFENQRGSASAILQAPPGAAFLDIVYSPLETTLLVQARLTGHPTLNGKGMNLAQAVDGFVNRVMTSLISEQGWEVDRVYGEVFQHMAQVW